MLSAPTLSTYLLSIYLLALTILKFLLLDKNLLIISIFSCFNIEHVLYTIVPLLSIKFAA